MNFMLYEITLDYQVIAVIIKLFGVVLFWEKRRFCFWKLTQTFSMLLLTFGYCYRIKF